MAWSTIRRATEQDENLLDLAAGRFAKRHGFDPTGDDFQIALADVTRTDGTVDHYAWTILRRFGETVRVDGDYLANHRELWRATVKRVLGDRRAEGIAYGYVGYEVK